VWGWELPDASGGARAQLQGNNGRDFDKGAAQERRVLLGADRDDLAFARDLAAFARDEAAERRDRATGPRDAIDRAAAAADRAAAAADRDAAARDREEAARERLAAENMCDALRRRVAIAETDQLTGARTRAAGLVDLDREIARAHRTGGLLVAVYVDVVGLKIVNDCARSPRRRSSAGTRRGSGS
jgi:predicted signal transduction protein with EAL and GGDEF domain